MTWLIATLIVISIGILILVGWRALDRRADTRAWRTLVASDRATDHTFDTDMLEGLPEPARRYFRYTIRVGTPLHRAVEIHMTGELGFGNKSRPNYKPMSAQQILAPPYGLVWKLKAGLISGSDGITPQSSWTRFWLFGVIPIVRVGKNIDHHRSAFGRLVSEGVFWAPASLLPSAFIRWEDLDANSTRAIISYGDFKQAVDIFITEDGQPVRVSIQRWSNENPDKVFCEQPFGGDLSEFRNFDGYCLPTRVEGGNHIGTKDYFPFYKAEVTSIRFPNNKDSS